MKKKKDDDKKKRHSQYFGLCVKQSREWMSALDTDCLTVDDLLGAIDEAGEEMSYDWFKPNNLALKLFMQNVNNDPERIRKVYKVIGASHERLMAIHQYTETIPKETQVLRRALEKLLILV